MAVKEKMSRRHQGRVRRNISKQGNSEGVNLPKSMRERLGIKAGDPVDLVFDETNNRVYIEPIKNNQVPEGVRPEVLEAMSEMLDMYGETLWNLRDR